MQAETFRNRLYQIGWTAQQCADRLRVNVRLVKRYVAGKIPVPIEVEEWINRVWEAQNAAKEAAAIPPPPRGDWMYARLPKAEEGPSEAA